MPYLFFGHPFMLQFVALCIRMYKQHQQYHGIGVLIQKIDEKGDVPEKILAWMTKEEITLELLVYPEYFYKISKVFF